MINDNNFDDCSSGMMEIRDIKKGLMNCWFTFKLHRFDMCFNVFGLTVVRKNPEAVVLR